MARPLFVCHFVVRSGDNDDHADAAVARLDQFAPSFCILSIVFRLAPTRTGGRRGGNVDDADADDNDDVTELKTSHGASRGRVSPIRTSLYIRSLVCAQLWPSRVLIC